MRGCSDLLAKRLANEAEGQEGKRGKSTRSRQTAGTTFVTSPRTSCLLADHRLFVQAPGDDPSPDLRTPTLNSQPTTRLFLLLRHRSHTVNQMRDARSNPDMVNRIVGTGVFAPTATLLAPSGSVGFNGLSLCVRSTVIDRRHID